MSIKNEVGKVSAPYLSGEEASAESIKTLCESYERYIKILEKNVAKYKKCLELAKQINKNQEEQIACYTKAIAVYVDMAKGVKK